MERRVSQGWGWTAPGELSDQGRLPRLRRVGVFFGRVIATSVAASSVIAPALNAPTVIAPTAIDLTIITLPHERR